MRLRTNLFTSLGAVLLAALFLLTLAGTAAAETTRERVKRQGYIRVAFANEAPFGYATSAGKLTGEAPEIAKAIFKKMGIDQVDGVLTEWASLIPGLRAGRFDMIAAGMFVNPKRCAQVAFSEPTYTLGQSFLVKAGNPKDLHSYQDVKQDSSVKLGVMAGAVERGYAREAGIPDSQIVELPDQASMLAAVRAGRVDAAALTALSIQNMADKGGAAVDRAEPFNTPVKAKGSGAFAFRKEDKDLQGEFNKHLKAFIGSKEHLALVKQFGFTRNELPEKSTSKLCSGM
jgi:polar amino acid transport system substrate-binding protein